MVYCRNIRYKELLIEVNLIKKRNLLVYLFISIILLTACGSNSSRTAENLLDQYVKAYTTADVDFALDLLPSFYQEHLKKMYTKEKFDASLASYKKEYGDDFNITYEINDKVKYTYEELDSLNEYMTSNYNAKEKALECYNLVGTFKYKGSKKESSFSLSMQRYCKYGEVWYLLGY